MHRPDPYDSLPQAIKQYYTRSEWMCLSDEQKANIQRDETEPTE